MILKDIAWALPVNVLVVECQCGVTFAWPSNFSLAECPICRARELWHTTDPPWPGFEDCPVMAYGLALRPRRSIPDPERALELGELATLAKVEPFPEALPLC